MADPLRRVNFFNGLMLTAADLAAEQEYRTVRIFDARAVQDRRLATAAKDRSLIG